MRKTFGGKATRYVWDAGELVHEMPDGSDFVTWVFDPGTFAPLVKEENMKRYGVVTDHLGAPRMLADEQEGHIVNTASAAGLLTQPSFAAYNVSKHGVVTLSEGLHHDLALRNANITVSVLCPAWVKTRV